jgi:deazaflavin-dependent oxidoreductase (nitroreductase family)
MNAPTDLGTYARRKTVELTTVGRRSGAPRKVVIWFVIDGPRTVLVQHVARKPAQWYRNLCADPRVRVDFGAGPIDARAQAIEDPTVVRQVLEKISRKYWTYRLIRLFGGGANDAVAARIEI